MALEPGPARGLALKHGGTQLTARTRASSRLVSSRLASNTADLTKRRCSGSPPQCCLISGESGAGKTETAKFFLNHLLYLEGTQDHRVQQHILRVSPVLEAFGNARTAHNDNSSRFGKYIQLWYDGNAHVVGAFLSK